nr:MAG TPA: hypothetical protein [Caudoviricetes sp.]
MQELIDYFEKIGNSKAPKKGLRKAGDHVLKVEKDVANNIHYKYATGAGVDQLKRSKVRSYKKKAFIDVGLKGKMSDWEKAKGLYFNHYGFFHNGWHKDGTAKNRKKTGIDGKYITGSRWMDKAFDKSKEKAYEILKDEMLKEFKKL